MLRIVFKNLEPSALAKSITNERMGDVVDKFPKLINHKMTVYLAKENSLTQPGPDLFSVKVRIDGRYYQKIVIEKSSPNMYSALSEMKDSLLDSLNRTRDRRRVLNRSNARRFIKDNESLGG